MTSFHASAVPWPTEASYPSPASKAIVSGRSPRPSDPPGVVAHADRNGPTGGRGSAGHQARITTNPRGDHARRWGLLAVALAATGSEVPSFVELSAAPTLVTTGGAATFAMALGLFRPTAP